MLFVREHMKRVAMILLAAAAYADVGLDAGARAQVPVDVPDIQRADFSIFNVNTRRWDRIQRPDSPD